MKKGKTYADRAREITSKYKRRLGKDLSNRDKYAEEAMNRELEALKQQQEMDRAIAYSDIQNKTERMLAKGGFINDGINDQSVRVGKQGLFNRILGRDNREVRDSSFIPALERWDIPYEQERPLTSTYSGFSSPKYVQPNAFANPNVELNNMGVSTPDQAGMIRATRHGQVGESLYDYQNGTLPRYANGGGIDEDEYPKIDSGHHYNPAVTIIPARKKGLDYKRMEEPNYGNLINPLAGYNKPATTAQEKVAPMYDSGQRKSTSTPRYTVSELEAAKKRLEQRLGDNNNTSHYYKAPNVYDSDLAVENNYGNLAPIQRNVPQPPPLVRTQGDPYAATRPALVGATDVAGGGVAEESGSRPYRSPVSPLGLAPTLLGYGLGRRALKDMKKIKYNASNVSPQRISLANERAAIEARRRERGNILKGMSASLSPAQRYARALAGITESDRNAGEETSKSFMNEEVTNAGYANRANEINAAESARAQAYNNEQKNRYIQANYANNQQLVGGLAGYLSDINKSRQYDQLLQMSSDDYEYVTPNSWYNQPWYKKAGQYLIGNKDYKRQVREFTPIYNGN